jgi:hypothetical protein
MSFLRGIYFLPYSFRGLGLIGRYFSPINHGGVFALKGRGFSRAAAGPHGTGL